MDAARIRALRTAMGLTHQQFSQKLGISYTTGFHWESGKFKPNVEHWQKLEELCKEHGV